MKFKNYFLGSLFLIAAAGFVLSSRQVLAAGAELPLSSEAMQDIEPAIAAYDIYEYYDTDMGASTSYSYELIKANGDIYCYEGSLQYRGREHGFYGRYIYHGDKRNFNLYQIIETDGSIITPSVIK